jgi:hypothetical protein
VRLIGVDTPETKDPDEGVEPYGEEASTYALTELEGEEVELEFGEERTDQYGRLLAYVYQPGDEMFNEDLLDGGYAQVYTVSPNDEHAPTSATRGSRTTTSSPRSGTASSRTSPARKSGGSTPRKARRSPPARWTTSTHPTEGALTGRERRPGFPQRCQRRATPRQPPA